MLFSESGCDIHRNILNFHQHQSTQFCWMCTVMERNTSLIRKVSFRRSDIAANFPDRRDSSRSMWKEKLGEVFFPFARRNRFFPDDYARYSPFNSHHWLSKEIISVKMFPAGSDITPKSASMVKWDVFDVIIFDIIFSTTFSYPPTENGLLFSLCLWNVLFLGKISRFQNGAKNVMEIFFIILTDLIDKHTRTIFLFVKLKPLNTHLTKFCFFSLK